MDFKDMKSFVLENHADVSAIMESHRLSISNASEIKILHGRFLTSFWEQRPNKEITYAIYFSEDCIDNLDFDGIAKNLTAITEELKTNNLIEVNISFEIITSAKTVLNEQMLVDLSNKKYVVFFFGIDGIDSVIRGKVIDKINMFYNESDRMKFAKKYRINEINECLRDYEVYIKEPGINEAFFASPHLIRAIRPLNSPLNTLHNKPEKILRDNLLSFLNRNTQHTFSKENELNNQRELDLYTEVEGKKYLIEVKWLGQSVNDSDTDLTQKVTDVSARDGVIQTLQYIKHLIEDMRYNVHCGYLCVFDVREIKNAINYRNFDFIAADLQVYFTNHFIKLDEIKLDRN